MDRFSRRDGLSQYLGIVPGELGIPQVIGSTEHNYNAGGMFSAGQLAML